MENNFVILRNGEQMNNIKAIQVHQSLREVQRKKILFF